ncbi:PTS system, glucose glucoside-specific enzyme IIA component [Companilactobacillus nodensis DSM 19682 = JCM 14932 = NBRC 107160]|uniref:PTS system, glucose glucoside-specific enzyme IIA component n=1 Tax=Companilactobacillus nodensis DSM 19682 = JCM 14932 = NBRC 107160 TaxID=1423775 RepID=A0A0R1KHX8_9LACO|nr:PTS glucose transporter subunit IIA [Companilactobacillus nodensis]KRK80537.1 PTS system, glucose glucoside-specific enzyme IIA component [Companilactobacillus nodensis DSM 19682 = JCM 14932 = NBRC 107160]
MGLFSHKKIETIVAPVCGQLINLEKVSDPVFAKKMMGDGLAIIPDGSTIVSPVNGIVVTIFPTKHAIMLKSKHGLEIMLHLGIDTVELNGGPFTMAVREGTKVTAGQKLAEMDLKKIKAAGKDDTVMVIITDTNEIKNKISYTERNITTGDPVFDIEL